MNTSIAKWIMASIMCLAMVLTTMRESAAACKEEGAACTSAAECCNSNSCYQQKCRPMYNFPSHAKVKVTRDPKGQSWLYLEFKWDQNCPPNFGSNRAVEFEIHIMPKCFLQPMGGKDGNHSCDNVMGKNKYNMPLNIIPGIGSNCYVDVWNYWIPSVFDIEDLLKDACPGFDEGNCARDAVLSGAFADKDGNFTVGLHDASALQAGVLYSVRYPVEINNSSECHESWGLDQGSKKPSSCYFSFLNEHDHGDWGRAWITMQTFENTCKLKWPCDSAAQFTCPELIGADHPLGGCENPHKYTDFWLNRLCVPTGDFTFTPGIEAVGAPAGTCINESNSADLTSHGACCWDWDGDGYFAAVTGFDAFAYQPEYSDVTMFGTNIGDCNDLDKTIHPGASDILHACSTLVACADCPIECLNGQGVCAPGDVQSQTCNGSGSQTSTCDSTCMWGPWSTCSVGPTCSPGQTASCGNCGTQTCNSASQWGACLNQGVCAPGDAQSQTCNGTGTQTQSCNATCQWGPWSSCFVNPSCSDGIQNQGETGVDCGGPCPPCSNPPTCSDGIQNQGESGVDCGGPCPPCCTASNYWNPVSANDTDNTGTQASASTNTAIIVYVKELGTGLQVQVCKGTGTFQNNVAFSIYDAATNGTVGAAVSNLATAGAACSPWTTIQNSTGYTQGQVFGGTWQVVSPASSASDWNWPYSGCSVNGSPGGTCWNGISVTLTRTCK